MAIRVVAVTWPSKWPSAALHGLARSAATRLPSKELAAAIAKIVIAKRFQFDNDCTSKQWPARYDRVGEKRSLSAHEANPLHNSICFEPGQPSV